MNQALYEKEVSKCVRCGACKTLCPTYLNTRNETFGARGRVAMLGELSNRRLAPTKRLAEKIFSCMLCGACKNICPAGINIPEVIYQGRVNLRKSYRKGRVLQQALKYSVSNMDALFTALRGCQKLFYQPLSKAGLLASVPVITSEPFKKSAQVYKNRKKRGRVAIFAGCSVNYFYPGIGNALLNILLSKGYEVVVFKGEACCGAPLRSMGFEQEAAVLAKRNIEHFNKVRAEAIISLCPTCTMVVQQQYPDLTGDTIQNIMDANRFLMMRGLAENLKITPAVATYHDPCHLSHGLGMKDEPRQILKGIQGVTFVEMNHADECCGFAGLFSLQYKTMSRSIGRKKIESITGTSADVVVTSCPGCIMQLQSLQQKTTAKFSVKHIIEFIDEAMHE